MGRESAVSAFGERQTVVVQSLGGGFTLSAVFGSEPDLIAAKGVLRDHVRVIREIIEGAA